MTSTRRKREPVSRSEFARRVGVTLRSVTQAIEVGRLSPPGEDGMLDFETAQREWVENRKRPSNDGTGAAKHGGAEGSPDWDNLLKREKYRAARRKREELERKLVRRDVAEAEAATLMATVRSRMDGLGRGQQDALAACTDPRKCGDMVDGAIRKVFEALADGAPEEESDG